MASPRLDKDTFKLLKSQREKLELLLLFPHDPKDKWPKWLAVFYAIEQGKKKGLDDDQIFDKTRLLEAVGHVDADTCTVIPTSLESTTNCYRSRWCPPLHWRV